MLYNTENMEGKWFEHENGYSALLYGESSMSVYFDEKEVLHTGSRNVNTDTDVMKMLESMPDLMEMVPKLSYEYFDDCDI